MKLFSWKKKDAEQTVQSLVEKGFLEVGLEMGSETGEWFALPGLG